MTASMADDDEWDLAALAELDWTAFLHRWRMSFRAGCAATISRAFMEKAQNAHRLWLPGQGPWLGLSARIRRTEGRGKADGRSVIKQLLSRARRRVRSGTAPRTKSRWRKMAISGVGMPCHFHR